MTLEARLNPVQSELLYDFYTKFQALKRTNVFDLNSDVASLLRERRNALAIADNKLREEFPNVSATAIKWYHKETLRLDLLSPLQFDLFSLFLCSYHFFGCSDTITDFINSQGPMEEALTKACSYSDKFSAVDKFGRVTDQP